MIHPIYSPVHLAPWGMEYINEAQQLCGVKYSISMHSLEWQRQYPTCDEIQKGYFN